MTQITPEEHSGLVGGSTAAQRLNCPRSYTIEKRIPKTEGDSVYAREGTALHEIMAVALQKDVEPTTLLPFTFTAPPSKGGWSFTVDSALWHEKGEPALAAFDEFVVTHEKRIGAKMRFLIETRVAFPGIPGAFGTSDIMAICGDEIFVMDWKFGNGLVPATENAQLMFYACGALNTSRDFFADMRLLSETPVTLAIIQPTTNPIVDHWRTDLGRLRRFEMELKAAVREAEVKGDTARIKTGPWCKFKRCQAICPLRVGAADNLARRFGDLQRAVAGKANDLPDILGDVLDLVEIVQPMCDAAKETALTHMQNGGAIAGWETKPGRAGNTRWAKHEYIVRNVLLEKGLDEDTVAPRKIVTPTQAKKLLGDLPDDLIDRGEPGKPTLVRRKDRETRDVAELAKRIVSPT